MDIQKEKCDHPRVRTPTYSSFLGFIVIILSILYLPSLVISCQVHLCSAEYEAALLAGQRFHRSTLRELKPRVSQTTAYCGYLMVYSQCMGSISKSCRGNLYYHAVITQVRRRIEENNCGISGETSTSAPLASEKDQDLTTPQPDQVRRRKKPDARRISMHCSTEGTNNSQMISSSVPWTILRSVILSLIALLMSCKLFM